MAIYLDNGATSFPKPEEVYRAVDRAMREFGANPGRGGHQLALAASRIVLETRETVAEFLGIKDSSRIIFTNNATMALNMALFGLLQAGDRVVTSTMEHNSVVRPLRALQERGVQVVKVAADQRGWVDPASVIDACRQQRTRLVVLSHCSNVTGTIQPFEEIALWCRREGILFCLDAAQSAGLLPIHADAMNIDLLAVPGHKGLFGPQGTGALYVRDGIELAPLIYGGTGANSNSELQPDEFPERLESGTLNTPGLAGLKAGIDFLNTEGIAKVRERETAHMAALLSGLKAIPGVELYGPGEASLHGGVVSFNLVGRDPAEIGFLLDHRHGILTRVGLHCAPDAHRSIGTFPRGTVRVSPGYFTVDAEIDQFLAALQSLASQSGH